MSTSSPSTSPTYEPPPFIPVAIMLSSFVIVFIVISLCWCTIHSRNVVKVREQIHSKIITKLKEELKKNNIGFENE